MTAQIKEKDEKEPDFEYLYSYLNYDCLHLRVALTKYPIYFGYEILEF